MTTYSAALMHFGNFIKQEYPDCDSDSVIDAIIGGKLDVYKLLDNFVSYIQSVRQGITVKTITAYMFGIRSYFAYHDVDIIPSKYRRKVFLPKSYREDEEPIDASDFRKLLLSYSNRRLKAYLLVLGSGGMRTIEALAIRNCDISFDTNPTRIHLRKEFSKTGVGRDIYISDEAT
jgi:integrase